jgi:hypothetical protein
MALNTSTSGVIRILESTKHHTTRQSKGQDGIRAARSLSPFPAPSFCPARVSQAQAQQHSPSLTAQATKPRWPHCPYKLPLTPHPPRSLQNAAQHLPHRQNPKPYQHLSKLSTQVTDTMTKANADGGAAGGKTFSENTVAIILMALGTTSISMAQYDMMSALDGQKTASSFQHQFRSVLQKAKDLKERVDNGETFASVTPTPKKRGRFLSSAAVSHFLF